ncbi:MAG: OmpA family protein [Acidobacteriota bacterium]
MVDSAEDGTDINVWVSFADVFAGLLLITLTGLGVAMHVYQARRPTDVRFSENLVQSMNLATSVTKALEDKLQTVLKSGGPQTSETEVVIPAEALFASGGYDAEARGMLLLTDIRQALREALDGVGERRRFLRVIIEGHTDSDPIRNSAVTREIPTNWELSSRRATGVLRFFEDGGLAPRDYNIVAMGLADSVPIAVGDKKRNRRIVIRIEPDIEGILQSIAGR